MLAPSLRSVANWVLPRFALSHLGAILLRLTANSVLCHFVPPHLGGRDLASLGRKLSAPSRRSSAPRGRDLASLNRELGAPSLRSSAPRGAQSHFARPRTRCSVTSFLHTLGGDLTSLGHWGVLPHFTQSLGGCSIASLSHWGDAPSLHSVAGGTLSCRWAQPIIGAII